MLIQRNIGVPMKNNKNVQKRSYYSICNAEISAIKNEFVLHSNKKMRQSQLHKE